MKLPARPAVAGPQAILLTRGNLIVGRDLPLLVFGEIACQSSVQVASTVEGAKCENRLGIAGTRPRNMRRAPKRLPTKRPASFSSVFAIGGPAPPKATTPRAQLMRRRPPRLGRPHARPSLAPARGIRAHRMG